MNGRGGPRGGRHDRRRANDIDHDQPRASVEVRASVALYLRALNVDHGGVVALVGEDADRLAGEVLAWDVALGHLATVGLVGIEPRQIKAVRWLSARWDHDRPA